jgi:hypothetical protein
MTNLTYSHDHAYGRYLRPLGWDQVEPAPEGRVRWRGKNGEIIDVFPVERLVANHWELMVLPDHGWPICGHIAGDSINPLLMILKLQTAG